MSGNVQKSEINSYELIARDLIYEHYATVYVFVKGKTLNFTRTTV